MEINDDILHVITTKSILDMPEGTIGLLIPLGTTEIWKLITLSHDENLIVLDNEIKRKFNIINELEVKIELMIDGENKKIWEELYQEI